MSGKKYLLNQKYFKPNYYKALENILPQYLKEDDIENFGTTDNLEDQVINSNIDAANNIYSLLSISSIEDTSYSALSSLDGISPYFVKQNKLTDITPARFEKNILNKLDKSFSDYKTIEDFSTYVSATLIPSITLNTPSARFNAGDSAADTHIYLTENLSWMYFLNTSGTAYNPSAFVTDQIIEKLYKGNTIQINDGIKGFMEFIWKNGNTGLYPSVFASGTDTHTSGTQQLDNLKTWVDVAYSPLYADSSDFTVRDKFEMFSESEVKTKEAIPNGPYTKLLRAMSFLAFDINNDSELISTLYDIEECPDDLLPLVAELIGWDLFGSDPERWRLQIRNAVDIYKSIGTKKSIQFAMNTVFPKDAFPIQSRITELYESYVPYLIYYALATESSKFKSFATWDQTTANGMDVSGYSTSSLDDNIRMAVDRILLETYKEFPEKFPSFPVEYSRKQIQGRSVVSLTSWKPFHYRGRDYPIPPFEEYPYYVNVELTPQMVEFIAERLACFGVRQQFALDTSGYIADNTLNVDEEPRAGSMLFFTSGYNDPPNLDKLILNLNDTKFEYVSLWSGKSSHFKLVFDASEFDFIKTGVDLGDTDSSDAFFIASKITRKMAPAHSIPLVSLELSATDNMDYSTSVLPLVASDKVELELISSRNLTVSGLVVGSYKRGVNPDGVEIRRGSHDNLYTTAYLGAVASNTLNRTTSRRRNFEKLMPTNGYYDRTGFNMPVSYHMASSLSGLPLGFVPSSCSYVDIVDYANLPAVYSRCETTTSPNSYNGFAVSNALPSRGTSALGLMSKYMDRGQLPPIYDTMHSIQERQKVLEAEISYGSVSSYVASVSNVYQAVANENTELNGAFPNSILDYYHFSFGRDISRLYQTYTYDFDRHALAPHIMELNGTNLFSHAWGPILHNNDFEDFGEGTENSVVSSLGTLIGLTPISTEFTGALSYVASAATDMYLDKRERVLSGLVDNVELIHTSGSFTSNSFSVLKVNSNLKTQADDPYMFDRTFISQRSTGNGLSRIRFDMAKYGQPTTSPVQDTFLLPEHKFKFSVKSLLTNSDGSVFGANGRQFGVWIHTKPEEGMMWSYTNGAWVQHDQLITKEAAIGYSKMFSFPSKTKEQIGGGVNTLPCLDIVTGSPTPASPVSRLRETDFSKFEVTFDTQNRLLKLPKLYRDNHPHLHRKDQEYVIEIILLPMGQMDEFMILDNVTLQDTTLKLMTEKFVGGTYQDPLCDLPYKRGGCEEFRVELTKEELMSVFRFFNDIAGKNSTIGYASREASNTAAVMGANGGSRTDFKADSKWTTRMFDVAGDDVFRKGIDVFEVDI